MHTYSGPGIFSPRRLGHVNFIVAELQRSIDFYQRACGLSLEFTEMGIRAGFMGVGHTPHDIGMIEQTQEARYGRDGHLQMPRGVASRIGLNHLAWEMENEAELVSAWERARAAGLAQTLRTVDHQIARSVYLRDPDGNMNEFYADTIVEWRQVLHGDMDLITSSWTPGEPEPSPEPRWHADPETRTFEGALMQPRRLSHAVLLTGSLEPMLHFYTAVAGLQAVYVDQTLALLQPRAAAVPYQLALLRSDRQQGLHHFSFAVDAPDDWRRCAQRLQEGGWQAEAVVDGPLKESVFVKDPDGFQVEFCAMHTQTPAGLAGELASLPAQQAVWRV
ncbi:VOC family protein [Bordetella trematum]|uniref:VOC family protein n=1 Tax=Bordetella trematum TaxID=123899 RepID=UPI000D9AE06A|nr:VOC family protein [Bordetella trematum]SPU54360.1 dioxygenase [Bordetella trematum]VDH02833.1 fosfomycin resistance protein FosB [Bordetella trematum]